MHTPPSTGLMGCWEGNAIFHDKAKNIRDAMKYIKHYSNWSSLKCSNVKYMQLHGNNQIMHVTFNNNFKVVYNSKFQKQKQY